MKLYIPIYLQVAVSTSFRMIKLKSLQRKTGLYNERGKHMNKLISLLTALGLIFGSVPCIALIFGTAAYADEDVHLSDAQKLEVLDDLEPDLLKNINSEYITRENVIDTLFNIYYKGYELCEMDLANCPYSDVTNGILYYKIRMVNYIGERLSIQGVGNGNFEPERNCTLSEFIKFSFLIAGYDMHVEIISQKNKIDVFPDAYIKCASEKNIVSKDEDFNRFITKDDVENILSKILFVPSIQRVGYSAIFDWSYPVIHNIYDIDFTYGKLNKLPGDKIKVGDTEITGSVDKSFYMKNCTALYKEDGEEKVLYKIFADESQAVD